MRQRLTVLLVLLLTIVVSGNAFDRPQKSDVIKIVHRVNQTWQQRHPTHGDFFWNRAAYYIGNMHAYEVTGAQAYLDYATAWAERNSWRGREGSDDPTEWKWSYGESYNYVLFGDNQVCFQVYADLYNLDPDKDPRKIARALEVMGYEISTDREDYIWWVDGLFMVMPVLSKLYTITGNQQYLEKMYTYWKWYTDRMWDTEEDLYYRDASYVYPDHVTLSGKKDFWARGCGWVFAAFAKILQDVPETDSHRAEYISYYRKMAASLKRCQQEAGYWERSLIDPEQALGYETSGTAFFAYGYAWGIKNGILAEDEYGETLAKAWDYLTTIALQADGTVGYIQPIGSKAIPGQYLYPSSYYDFGVGAFLMAASEMSKLAVGDYDTNRVELENLIDNCESNYGDDFARQSVGTNLFQHSQESYDAFLAVLEQARKTAGLSTATASELVAVRNSLEQALQVLLATCNEPDTQASYQIKLIDTELYMSLTYAEGETNGRVRLSDTPFSFSFVEANQESHQYYLSDGIGYVGIDGKNNWTTASAAEKRTALSFHPAMQGEQLYYTIQTRNGHIGVDSKRDQAECYVDKNGQEERHWWVIERVPSTGIRPVFRTSDSRWYDLQGRPARKSGNRGVVVRDGKKML